MKKLASEIKDFSVKVKVLPAVYPQGGEKVLVYHTTGRKIHANQLPIDVGCIVLNCTTVAAIGEYLKTGMPLVERCITVDGSAVADPKNLIVPIGALVGDVIEAAGGLKEEAGKILYGGPMMGIPVCSLEEPTLKNNNGLTVFTKKDATVKDATACIHCGKCVEKCPMSLYPTSITAALEISNKDDRMAKLEELNILLCMECGCCSYICPASRPLVQNNRLAKNAYRAYTAHKATLK